MKLSSGSLVFLTTTWKLRMILFLAAVSINGLITNLLKVKLLHCIDLFRFLKWLPFQNRVCFKTAIMMYKT